MNDAKLDAREARRIKADDRCHARMVAKEDKAERMIGELASGAFYVFPVGGKYRESRSKVDLIAFLVRNKYV
jgi:hypothetical protein